MNDGYVTALYEAGVFIGTKIGDLTYFYPNSSITRAEVATIVYRIYQLSSLDQKQKIHYRTIRLMCSRVCRRMPTISPHSLRTAVS